MLYLGHAPAKRALGRTGHRGRRQFRATSPRGLSRQQMPFANDVRTLKIPCPDDGADPLEADLRRRK